MRIRLDTIDANNDKFTMYFDPYTVNLYDENDNLIDITTNHDINSFMNDPELKHYTLQKLLTDTPPNKTHVKITNPKQLHIHLGEACNLSCKYCNHTCHDPIHVDDIKLDDLLNNMIKHISFDRLHHVHICGGETFLYWNQLVTIHTFLLQRVNPHCDFVVFTNGTVLTQDKVDYLSVPNNRFRVCISHDGIGQEYRSHDLQSNKCIDPFTDSKSFSLIKQLSDDLPPGNFLISCTLNNKNYDFEKNIEFFNDLFGDKYLMFYSVPTIADEQQLNCFTDNGEHTFSSWDIVNHLIRSKDTLKNPFFPMVYHLLQKFTDNEFRYNPGHSHCSALNPEAIVLNLNGDVIVCHSDCTTKYGHLTKLDELVIPDLWVPNKRKTCLTCPVVSLCSGGCVCNPSGTKYQVAECSIRYHHFFGLLVYTIYLLTNRIVTVCYGDFPNATTLPMEDSNHE